MTQLRLPRPPAHPAAALALYHEAVPAAGAPAGQWLSAHGLAVPDSARCGLVPWPDIEGGLSLPALMLPVQAADGAMVGVWGMTLHGRDAGESWAVGAVPGSAVRFGPDPLDRLGLAFDPLEALAVSASDADGHPVPDCRLPVWAPVAGALGSVDLPAGLVQVLIARPMDAASIAVAAAAVEAIERRRPDLHALDYSPALVAGCLARPWGAIARAAGEADQARPAKAAATGRFDRLNDLALASEVDSSRWGYRDD